MLRGLLNKHWFIKRFMPVYIAGLIVAGFGFTAHASAATISQIVSDTQTNESPAQGEKIGTNISGVPQSITIKWSHSLGGSVGLELKLLECPSSSYNTFTTECRFINSGSEGHGALALQTGASATDVTFDLSTTPPFNPSKFYAFNVVNSTDADDTLGATCITGECARHSNSYGTSNDVVGFGCTNSNEFGEGPGICGSVKNLYFVLTFETSCQISPSGLNTCDLQKGDILLLHTINPLSITEAQLFAGYWSHAGIYNGDGTITEAYPDPIFIGLSLNDLPGVVSHPVAQSLFWNTEIDDWAILRVDSLNATQQGNAVTYAQGKADGNHHYNYNFGDKLTELKF